MKLSALAVLALAVVVRLAWRSSYALAIPMGHGVRKGFTISSLVFWALVIIGITLLTGAS